MALAVGAFGEESSAVGVGGDELDNSAPNSGSVYVFEREDGAWAQRSYVKASNPGNGDLFGFRIAMSSDAGTLAIGAYGESSGASDDQLDDAKPDAGAVYIY
jgi:hypothetical protein